MLKVITSKTIGTYYFPYLNEYKEFQNQKVRHYEKLSSISKLDSLDTVAVRPIEFDVKEKVPFANLAIPVTYKLNKYNQESSSLYVPKHETRLFSLRQGADDELTQIDAGLNKSLVLKAEESLSVIDTVSEVKSAELSPSMKSMEFAKNKKETKIIDLVPSPQLSEPIDYSPMHIFVITILISL